MRIPMIFRFSLYGFLKNQQYYDPFIYLAFLEKGLSFFMIGLLIGFRELCVNLMEVPTGVIADLFGRRRAMILSFTAYVISFAIFGTCTAVEWLFAAMFFFAIGEAFRTGTHKAMILDWLRLQGRQNEKTRVYGYTRSWSKMGSAVAAWIAAALIVFHSGRFGNIFLFCIPVYVLGIINFLGYPPELDGRYKGGASLGDVVRHLFAAFRKVIHESRLRRVILEAAGYECMCKVTKDYLQPILMQMAMGLTILVSLGDVKRTAILIACVYSILQLGAAVTSRKSHAFAGRFGGEYQAARNLWLIAAALLTLVTVSLWVGILWPAVVGFVVLELSRNLWRPMTITRVDNETDATMGATMLSIESQAKATGAMVLAPLIGYGVDALAKGPKQPALWVAGAVALVVAIIGAVIPAMKPAPAEANAENAERDV